MAEVSGAVRHTGRRQRLIRSARLAALYGVPGLAALVISYFGLGGYGRDWHVPLDLNIDTLLYLPQIKTTIETGWWWNNPRIGAPLGFDALLFPSNTNVDQAIVFLVSLVSEDLGLVANVTWLLMLATSGTTAMLCLRLAGLSHMSAAICAVLFAISPYAIYRNIGHFSLATYLVPFPAILAIRLASGSKTPARRQRIWPLIAGGALLGLNYVYYAFFGALFVSAGTVAGWLQTRDWRVLRIGFLGVAVISLATAINLAPSFWEWRTQGKPMVVREKVPAESEVYGLKVRHLLGPVFESAFPPFRRWNEAEAAARFPLETENVISRLGVVASLGFIGSLLAVLFPWPQLRAGTGLVENAGRAALIGVLFGTVGGFGSIFSLLATPDIRGWNRITPFIGLFSLLAVGAALDAMGMRRRGVAAIAAGAVLVGGLLDQSPAFRGLRTAHAAVRADYAELKQFIQLVESGLPYGALVLQVPFTIYLNDEGRHGMRPYDHMRPYLVSRHLRWSYPALSNAQYAWQEAASRLSDAELLGAAAYQGFNAILADKAGFADGAAAFVATATTAGGRVIAANARYVVIDLSTIRPDLRRDLLPAPGAPARATTGSMIACDGVPRFSIDRLGALGVPLSGAPPRLRQGQTIDLSGWFLGPSREARVRGVELLVDTDLIVAAYGFGRPDVAAAFAEPTAASSGFRARADGLVLAEGEHQLRLRGRSEEHPCYFETPAVRFIVE